MNLFGKKKTKSASTGKSAGASKAAPFSRVQIFSKPEAIAALLKGVREETISAEVSRQKLKAASLVSGRGTATLHNYQLAKFKSGPRPVAVVGYPKAKPGGNFVPADNPLEPGESIELTYEMALPQAGGNTLYFSLRGVYIQTAIYIPNAEVPHKPWVASREVTEKKLGEKGIRQGEEVLQIRTDQITVYPNAPESFTGDQIAPYVFSPVVYVVSGGGMWAKKVTDYFEGVQDPIEKHLEDLENKELLKTISGVNLVDFGVDTITMIVNNPILEDVEHDNLLPSMRRKPNDHLPQLNSCLGFLLKFEVNDDVKELLMRTFAQKIGKEVEVYLPLTLGHLTEAEPPKERIVFQIFPRDLVQETNPARRKSSAMGLKFMPPFTLHPNAEDQNTYRKLMVAIGQRIKDDSRPEEERNKLASVQAQVAQRREETKGKYVDENMRKAFLARQEARKRREAQG